MTILLGFDPGANLPEDTEEWVTPFCKSVMDLEADVRRHQTEKDLLRYTIDQLQLRVQRLEATIMRITRER